MLLLLFGVQIAVKCALPGACPVQTDQNEYIIIHYRCRRPWQSQPITFPPLHRGHTSGFPARTQTQLGILMRRVLKRHRFLTSSHTPTPLSFHRGAELKESLHYIPGENSFCAAARKKWGPKKLKFNTIMFIPVSRMLVELNVLFEDAEQNLIKYAI